VRLPRSTAINETLQILFPNLEVVLRLVEQANGNRLSTLAFHNSVA